MIRELISPDVTAHHDATRPTADMRSRAHLLQEDVRHRLQKKSHSERSDIYHRASERAIMNGLELQPLKDGKPVYEDLPFTRVPAFLDRETMQDHARDVQHVYNALLKIEDLALSGTELGNEVLATVTKGMDDDQVEMLHKARGRRPQTARNRNSRADAFIKADEMDIIEINNINPEGLTMHRALTEVGLGVLNDTGLNLADSWYYDLEAQRFQTAAHQGLSMLQREFASRPGNEGKPLKRIGIVYEHGQPKEGEEDIALINRSEMSSLSRFFRARSRHGIEVFNGDPTDIETANNRMRLGGEDIDIMWRNAVDIPKAVHNPEAAGFIDVISHPETYPLLNDETSQIIGSKATLSLLFDKRVRKEIGMTKEEEAAVERSVPFSFIPDADVRLTNGAESMTARDYLMKYRKYFVLKPTSGTHGNEVVFGPNGGQAWDDAVERAVDSGMYLAQRYIPYERIHVPVLELGPDGTLDHETYMRDTNLHKIGPEVSGTSISRIVPLDPDGKLKILNVAGGGGLQTTFLA